MTSEIEPLWEVKDVMAYLKRGRSWVYEQVAAGTLPHLRIGVGGLRFDPAEVRTWALRQRSGHASVTPIRYTSP
jgi:predicted DNA-binding transcriptional regulator AlpA